jgi:hypothetical protein
MTFKQDGFSKYPRVSHQGLLFCATSLILIIKTFIYYLIINREFISDRHGSEVQNYNILKFFFLTNNGMGTSTPIIKSFRPILLTAVTFFKTHRFLYIKILIFLIFF